jgi:hypothetical protein
MNIKQSRESLVFDYRTLRLFIGAIALAFPAMVAALTGKITTSISASYHEPAARNVFVGFLFILGALLISYKGHRLPVSDSTGGKLWVRIRRDQEDWISALGGIAAIFTAMFPTACDGCSLDTIARIHTIGAFVLFAPVVYFSLIAFLRSLNKKLQAYEELRQIQNVIGNENSNLFRKVFAFLFSEILLFRKIVAEVSQNYDKQYSGQYVKSSVSYRQEKRKFLLDAYGQKIRRGFVYVICGSVIAVVLLGFVPTALVMPDLVTGSEFTFIVETISLWFFGVAWMTAGHLGYLRKIRLLWALRQRKQSLVPELGSA